MSDNWQRLITYDQSVKENYTVACETIPSHMIVALFPNRSFAEISLLFHAIERVS